MVRPAGRREMVRYLQGRYSISLRRACDQARISRSLYGYRSRRTSQDALRGHIRELAGGRLRYGYRRIHLLLRREGWKANRKRVYRMYREEGLTPREFAGQMSNNPVADSP
jgi:putative transposase